MKRVKCTDNTGNAKNLIKDSKYIITEEKNGLYLIGRAWWAKSRFEIVVPCYCAEFKEAIEEALRIAEQSIEDPDTVLIEHLKESLDKLT